MAGSSTDAKHPFANSKQLLVLIPNDKVDIEEEVAFYDQFEQDIDALPSTLREDAISVYSHTKSEVDIWFADNTSPPATMELFGSSSLRTPFARDVTLDGWSIVGDTGKSPLTSEKGGYVVYDCCITTRDGRKLHAHKRYSAFEELELRLHSYLPRSFSRIVPQLPPKSPLSRYRPKFLLSRQRQLQEWLSQVLLHPDLGGTPVVKEWVMSRD